MPTATTPTPASSTSTCAVTTTAIRHAKAPSSRRSRPTASCCACMGCVSFCNRAERVIHRARRLLVAAMLVLVPAIASAQRMHRYEVGVASDLSRLRIHACFDGVPARLFASAPEAARFLRDLHVAGATARTLEASDDGITLQGIE